MEHASSMTEVTRLLEAIEHGSSQAAAELLPVVYEELRRLAAQQMSNERTGQTLNGTALVHEAYLRLVGPGDHARWQSRSHFFRAAAQAMRRILVDNARRKEREKHGGGRKRIALEDKHRILESSDELLALDESLTRFGAIDPEKAELVKLRFFANMSMTEAASALGVSLSAAERWWTYARAWLAADLRAAKAPIRDPCDEHATLDGRPATPFNRDAEYSERSANRPVRTTREVRAPLRKAFASRLNGG